MELKLTHVSKQGPRSQMRPDTVYHSNSSVARVSYSVGQKSLCVIMHRFSDYTSVWLLKFDLEYDFICVGENNVLTTQLCIVNWMTSTEWERFQSRNRLETISCHFAETTYHGLLN